LDARDGTRRVAIACQGGGSHTAFTAGVLKRLLRQNPLKGYEIVGLSGTSGGAVCALLAWYALLNGDGERAAGLLDEFWEDNSATAPHEMLANYWTIWASKLQNFLVTPAVSPYDNFFSMVGLNEFRRMLERRVNFEKIEVQPEGSYPVLLVGAVDVLSGEFRAFNSQREDHRRHDPGFGGHPHPVLVRTGRWGDILGLPLLAEPPGQGTDRREAGRDLGDPDKPKGGRG
jgi:NTE family protein